MVAALQLAEVENVIPRQSVAVAETASEEVQHDLQEARERRSRFNFTMVDIPIGAVLRFTRDESLTATVTDARHVTFNGQVTSLSEAARQALITKGLQWAAVQGPRFWQYEGEILEDRRQRLEGGE